MQQSFRLTDDVAHDVFLLVNIAQNNEHESEYCSEKNGFSVYGGKKYQAYGRTQQYHRADSCWRVRIAHGSKPGEIRNSHFRESCIHGAEYAGKELIDGGQVRKKEGCNKNKGKGKSKAEK